MRAFVELRLADTDGYRVHGRKAHSKACFTPLCVARAFVHTTGCARHGRIYNCETCYCKRAIIRKIIFIINALNDTINLSRGLIQKYPESN